jgi:predicted metal-dependent enzyme (double-stranded beta helix superfamily)
LETLEKIAPLRDFVVAMTNLVGTHEDEDTITSKGRPLLATLISDDSWLPDFCTVSHPEFYQQFLLHADPLERFSIVSFVWGPGQHTPVHDHCVWGLLGVLRGAELCQRYGFNTHGEFKPIGPEEILAQGEIDLVSPSAGDIHVVKNASQTDTAISIHVYGHNIGAVARHVYDPITGAKKNFVSGYSSPQVPNLWDRSAKIRNQLANT